VREVNIIGYKFLFFDYFFLDKPELIGFVVDKLIKPAHNMIKDEHKLIKQ